MLDVSTGSPSGWQIIFRIASLYSLEMSAALPLLSHPPLVSEVAASSDPWNGDAPCPYHPYFHKAEPCNLGGLPLCVKRASVSTAISAPHGPFRHILLSSLYPQNCFSTLKIQIQNSTLKFYLQSCSFQRCSGLEHFFNTMQFNS